MRYDYSMLDLAILGLLNEGPLHGYEIRRRLRAHLGMVANVSFGSLYPALARLEAAGDVEALASEDDELTTALPSTGSLSGERAAQRAKRLVGGRGRRSRKVYRVTDAGTAHFATLLNASSGTDDSRSFGLRWSFARHLAPSSRLALLERRRAQLVQRLGETADSELLDPYARSVVKHAADGVASDIAWLDDLIEVERTSMNESMNDMSTSDHIAPSASAGRGANSPADAGANN
jgi:hypothetical protein